MSTNSQNKPNAKSSSGGGDGGKKRKYYGNTYYSSRNNPKRGGPGVLLTAETGREHKCKVEALDILEHYLAIARGDDEKRDNNGEQQPPLQPQALLSLEEELKQLKSNNNNKSRSNKTFGVYETGVKGTVFLMCTIPGCNLIPSIKSEYKKSDETSEQSETDTKDRNDNGNSGEQGEGSQAKKQRLDPDKEENGKKKDDSPKTQVSSEQPPPWDPIQTVQNVISDLEQNSKDAPSSRFVTRMIPIQATCFASVGEIRSTCQALLKKYLPSTTKTFAVAPRRRICSNLKTIEIIDTVAALVLESIPECKVKLEDPDVTIVVEICKTLCGMSVVPNCKEFRNFNLVAVREQNE